MQRTEGDIHRKMCIAIFNAELHASSICPGNHDVSYEDGCIYMDGKKIERYDLQHKANEYMDDDVSVAYSPVWNTFVVVQGEW